MKLQDAIFPLVAILFGGFLIATSIPLGSPHIYAYCLLSQIGTVPVDTDAFRIFCLKEPTNSGPSGVEGGHDKSSVTEQSPTKRPYTLYEYETYDRYLPQSMELNDRLMGEDDG